MQIHTVKLKYLTSVRSDIKEWDKRFDKVATTYNSTTAIRSLDNDWRTIIYEFDNANSALQFETLIYDSYERPSVTVERSYYTT